MNILDLRLVLACDKIVTSAFRMLRWKIVLKVITSNDIIAEDGR